MTRTIRSLILAALCTCCALATVTVPVTAGASTTPSAPSTLRLVLPLAANSAGLAHFVAEVSTPGSPLYGHYRSIAWLAQHFGASAATEQKVVAYLRANGATAVRLDRTGLFVDATLKTATAQALFGTALDEHSNRAGNDSAPAGAAQVPAALKRQLTGVIGLDTRPVVSAPDLRRSSSLRTDFSSRATRAVSAFSSVSAAIARPDSPIDPSDPSSGYQVSPSAVPPLPTGTPSGCAAAQAIEGFTPNEYLTAYNYGALHSSGTLGQGERVALIEVDGFYRSDIAHFDTCFALRSPKIVTFRTDPEVPKNGLAPGGESTLDLEVLSAAAPGLSQIDVYQSGQDIASVMSALTSPLQNSGYKPEVISASLGLCEPQVRSAIGLGGLRDAEAALEEAAASGISVLAASGDDGSADCVDSDSETALPLPKLAVNFPASSPYVTAVGGTNLSLTPANAIQLQQVWNDASDAPGAAGGGGTSTLFRRPSYQQGVVTSGSRVLPDVAMLADIAPGYDVYCTAQPDCVSSAAPNPWQAVGGTSASTPLLAGGIALIDELLRQHKQQSLGLVNPLLYSLGKDATAAPLVFSDVTTGSNDVGPYIRASHAPLGCCTAGVGFDAASGWGSVSLGNLATAARDAQPALVNVSESLPPRQTPVLSKRINVNVTCTGVCVIGAYARITIGHGRPATFYSGLYHRTSAGTKLVKIILPAAELTKLRFGLTQHLRVTASVVGAILDAAGNIERSTPAKSLTVTR